MAIKHEGTIEELQTLLKNAGLKGKWEDDSHPICLRLTSDFAMLPQPQDSFIDS